MKYPLFAIASLVLLSFSLFGQSPTPAPTSTPTSDTDVVKINTNIIQVDISVTDSKGNTVTDLKPDEVEIYENGQKQKLSGFSFINVAPPPAPSTNPKPAQNDPASIPVPTSEIRPDQVRRTFALVVDDLTLSFESTSQVRRALKKFVDEQMQDGDLVAIVRTGAGVGALQQFTSDKRLLYAAIDRVKWNPSGNGGISAFSPIEPTMDDIRQMAGDTTESDEEKQDNINKAKSESDFESSFFATGTLGALQYIVKGMSELPGRKSVILFSDGFKMLETDEHGFTEGGLVEQFLKRLADLANRSSVVFYTLDARGLQYTGLTAADNISNPTPDAINTAMSDRDSQLLDTQDGLAYLAEETGGIAVKNTNDLSGGVSKILKNSSYYLVAYEPDAETFDPKTSRFNKLTVKVLRQGLTVRYRSGFFNVTTAERPTEPVKMTPVQQLQTALTSPFGITGISLHLNALFGNDTKQGSYVKSLLRIDLKDFVFKDTKDGRKQAIFDILAASFGDNGQVVSQFAQTHELSISAEDYKKYANIGYVYQFVFPVKKPGAYQYRVAIRDEQGGKLGSASQFIEVPELKKGKLTTSSIVLEDLTQEEWARLADPNAKNRGSTSMNDTAMRQAKVGTIMQYGYEIYNAKLEGGKPNLKTRIRVFRDGKIVLDGKETTFDATGQTDMTNIRGSGAMSLGGKMLPGDYILQVIVVDGNAPEKKNLATQVVQFELVD